MEIIIGLIIIAIGSFCQSSSYVPIKKVKEWSWESFWLLQGVFAWLVFPLLGALLGIPQGSSLFDLWGTGGAPMSIFLWYIMGSRRSHLRSFMRYLGVALGQSIALGTCAGFGTLFPAIFAGTNLFEGNGLILLLGVCITFVGYCHYRICRQSSRQKHERRRKTRGSKRFRSDQRTVGSPTGRCDECLFRFRTRCRNAHQRSCIGRRRRRALCRTSRNLPGNIRRFPD